MNRTGLYQYYAVTWTNKECVHAPTLDLLRIQGSGVRYVLHVGASSCLTSRKLVTSTKSVFKAVALQLCTRAATAVGPIGSQRAASSCRQPLRGRTGGPWRRPRPLQKTERRVGGQQRQHRGLCGAAAERGHQGSAPCSGQRGTQRGLTAQRQFLQRPCEDPE